jgi:hypothetical protein
MDSPSTTQYGQWVSFSATRGTHFADFANIGWSLDNVTEISKTLSFMVSAILFAFSSENLRHRTPTSHEQNQNNVLRSGARPEARKPFLDLKF